MLYINFKKNDIRKKLVHQFWNHSLCGKAFHHNNMFVSNRWITKTCEILSCSTIIKMGIMVIIWNLNSRFRFKSTNFNHGRRIVQDKSHINNLTYKYILICANVYFAINIVQLNLFKWLKHLNNKLYIINWISFLDMLSELPVYHHNCGLLVIILEIMHPKMSGCLASTLGIIYCCKRKNVF